MAQFFSEKADLALERWLAPESWLSDHWTDERRFYRFVDTLVESGEWDSIYLKLIEAVKHYHPDIDIESVKDRVSELAGNARVVSHYIDAKRHSG